jgi:hypothetical protein
MINTKYFLLSSLLVLLRSEEEEEDNDACIYTPAYIFFVHMHAYASSTFDEYFY